MPDVFYVGRKAADTHSAAMNVVGPGQTLVLHACASPEAAAALVARVSDDPLHKLQPSTVVCAPGTQYGEYQIDVARYRPSGFPMWPEETPRQAPPRTIRELLAQHPASTIVLALHP